MTRPSRDDTLMQVAEAFAKRSTCDRAHVGAVVARQGRILATGYNGAPAGIQHCHHASVTVDNGPGLHEPCLKAVHAEANAIAWAARYGMALHDAQMYCTHAPCLPCAQIIVNAGISSFVFHHPYRLVHGLELLDQAGVEVTRV